MEPSALEHRDPAQRRRRHWMRLQSDERLVASVRHGSHDAFAELVRRYRPWLLAQCRQLVRSREDAEDVIQDVFAAAFKAMVADDRPISVRPWLYRITRNRSLNQIRHAKSVALEAVEEPPSDNGASAADVVQGRDQFRLLARDINELPEAQRSALLLREMMALSHAETADVMGKTVPSVKSLLVRARRSLSEAAEARGLSCEEARAEVADPAESSLRPAVRRHVRTCERCAGWHAQQHGIDAALAAAPPVGLLARLKQLALGHVGHSSGAAATGAGTLAPTLTAASSAGSLLPAAVGAISAKTVAGLAAAALVTAVAVDNDGAGGTRPQRRDSRPTPHTLVGAQTEPSLAHPHAGAVRPHSDVRIGDRRPEQRSAPTTAATSTLPATTAPNSRAAPPPAQRVALAVDPSSVTADPAASASAGTTVVLTTATTMAATETATTQTTTTTTDTTAVTPEATETTAATPDITASTTATIATTTETRHSTAAPVGSGLTATHRVPGRPVPHTGRRRRPSG